MAANGRAGQNLRAVELCVGAGGLALGISRAGFNEVTVLDIDRQACDSLRRNRDNKTAYVCNWNIIETDIGDLDLSDYAEVELLSGGPPCQPFSRGGKRKGRSDPRDMFPQFIRAVRECSPKTFIIENVRGLRDGAFFSYFCYILLQLRYPQVQRRKSEKWKQHRVRLERLATSGNRTGADYNVIWQVLNAVDYGVAQRRERVFIVGVRADLGIQYSFPVATHTREALLVDQWVTGAYWKRHGITGHRIPLTPQSLRKTLPKLDKDKAVKAWCTVRDAISDLPELGADCASHKILNHFLNPGARPYPGHDGSRMDTVAKTIKAGHHGVPGGENMVRLDNGTVRYFSIRECARLQSFPDDWAFDGSWCSCMRHIGNAVPVTLGEVVAAPIVKSLLGSSG